MVDSFPRFLSYCYNIDYENTRLAYLLPEKHKRFWKRPLIVWAFKVNLAFITLV